MLSILSHKYSISFKKIVYEEKLMTVPKITDNFDIGITALSKNWSLRTTIVIFGLILK